VFLIGISLGHATEAAAAITAIYVLLVFFQLREMEEQRRGLRQQREQDLERERARRPILQIGPFEMRPPLLRRAAELEKIATGDDETIWKQVGFGYYVNLPLTNVGQTLARGCQPLVTSVGEHAEGKGWARDPNWLPIGLRWVLDELNVEAHGKPTEERNLVPRRPYLFNLGNVSTQHPSQFRLILILVATGQRHTFPPGDYCFEITVYSENAEPTVKWYRVQWRGGFKAEHVAKALERDPAEIRRWLEVEELTAAPWAATSAGADV
jgi:hypothetical protein